MIPTVRLSALLALFVTLFSALGLRLWFVQIAEGAAAAEVTQGQSWVYVATPAPRGDIRDRDGDLLVTSRFVPAVVVDRHLVDAEQRAGLVQRLSSLLAVPAEEIDAMYEAAGVNGRFRVATIDVTDAYRINEQLRDLPGVSIEKVPQRVYLTGEIMSHVIGHLGLPTDADLTERPDLDPNTRIGQLGVERVYDQYLQGSPGEIAFQVRLSDVIAQRPEVAAVPGDTVYLTLDLELQEVVSSALRTGVVDLSNSWKAEQRRLGNEDRAKNETVRGAAVVLDARTGAVLAMDSFPRFDPALFVGGVDPITYQGLAESQAFLNLAVSGLYPPASTFKAVTYMTALEHGLQVGGPQADPANGRVHCDGVLELPGLLDGSPQRFFDWYREDKGWLDLHEAFEQSCNIYFYSLALGIWENSARSAGETVIQEEARALGFGTVTGVDLTGEASGIVPDRDLFLRWQELQREDEEAPRLLDATRLEMQDPWFGGDLMNVAIGQGSVSATPLQVAVAYAALANGGKVLQPYVVDQIRDAAGDLVFANTPEVTSEVPLAPEHVASLLADMNRVVTRGTAAAAFSDFGPSLRRVGGKTGTGQSVRTADNHAWFVGVAPIDDPRYVVVVLIDQGGSGGAVAAPVARHILQYVMGETPTPIVAGAAAD